MNRKRIIWVCVALGLAVFGLASGFSRISAPKYRAQTLIRVLPYAEKDPMTFATPAIDKDIQYGFRVSMATLIKRQALLQNLLMKDKVQSTSWFRNFGESNDVRLVPALKDLKRNFEARAQKTGNFIEVSMVCDDRVEAALILNEMVDLFIVSQTIAKRRQIDAKLANLSETHLRIQRELRLAEQGLADIRMKSGFTDMETPAYLHPVTVRLNRLQLEKDNLVLQISQTQTTIEILEKQAGLAASEKGKDQPQANLKSTRNDLIVLQSKLEELEKMLTEAVDRKKGLDIARIKYKRGTSMRDERRQRVNEIMALVEKLNIMHNDPETPKVQFVERAPEPLEPSPPDS